MPKQFRGLTEKEKKKSGSVPGNPARPKPASQQGMDHRAIMQKYLDAVPYSVPVRMFTAHVNPGICTAAFALATTGELHTMVEEHNRSHPEQLPSLEQAIRLRKAAGVRYDPDIHLDDPLIGIALTQHHREQIRKGHTLEKELALLRMMFGQPAPSAQKPASMPAQTHIPLQKAPATRAKEVTSPAPKAASSRAGTDAMATIAQAGGLRVVFGRHNWKYSLHALTDNPARLRDMRLIFLQLSMQHLKGWELVSEPGYIGLHAPEGVTGIPPEHDGAIRQTLQNWLLKIKK